MFPVQKKAMTCVKCKLHGKKALYANGHRRWCPYKECPCESCVEHEQSLEIRSKEKLKIKEMEFMRTVEEVIPSNSVKFARQQMERRREGKGGVGIRENYINNNFSSRSDKKSTVEDIIDLSSDNDGDGELTDNDNNGNNSNDSNPHLTDDDLPDPEAGPSKSTHPSTSKITPRHSIFSNYLSRLDYIFSPPRPPPALPVQHTPSPLGNLPTSTPTRKRTVSSGSTSTISTPTRKRTVSSSSDSIPITPTRKRIVSSSSDVDLCSPSVWTPLPSPPQVSSDSSPTPISLKTKIVQPNLDFITLSSDSETEVVPKTTMEDTSNTFVQGEDQFTDKARTIYKHCGIREIVPKYEDVISTVSDPISKEKLSNDNPQEVTDKTVDEPSKNETLVEGPEYKISIQPVAHLPASAEVNTNEDHFEDEASSCIIEASNTRQELDIREVNGSNVDDISETQSRSEFSAKRPSRWDVPPPGWSPVQFLHPPPPVSHLARIAIPDHQVGLLLGREGHYLKKMRLHSGASISLGPPGYCTVEGSASGVDQACRMIANRLWNR